MLAKHCWQHSWLSRLEANYLLPPLPSTLSIASNTFHCHQQQEEGNNNKVGGSAAIWGNNFFPSVHAQRRSRNKGPLEGTQHCSFHSQTFPEQLDLLLCPKSSPAWAPYHCLLTTPCGPTSKTNSNHWGGFQWSDDDDGKCRTIKENITKFSQGLKKKFWTDWGRQISRKREKALIR